VDLVAFRAALRLDLFDPAGGSQRFADADLDRAVTRAVAELSLAAPRQVDTEVALGAASRTVPLPGGTFPGLTDVEQVEYPYGAAGALATMPPTLVPFRVAPDLASLLIMTAAVPAVGDRLRVRWLSPYAVTVGTTTVPVMWDGAVAQGAFAYACLAYSTPASDNFKYDDGATVAGVDDSMIPKEWRARYGLAIREWSAFLERLRAGRAIGGARVVWSQRQPAALWPSGAAAIGVEP
jgi:hypothetical protein